MDYFGYGADVMGGILQMLLAAAASAATVTKTDNKVDTTNGASYSFASTNLGTVAANRYIVVCVSARSGLNSRTVASCTVAGAATTKLVEGQTGTTQTSSAIFITNAVDATNATGTVVVNSSGGNLQNCGITVYAVTGLVSTTADNTKTTVNDADPLGLTTVSGGVAIGVVTGLDSGANRTFTWTNLTETVDQTVESSSCTQGSAASTTTGGTLTVTATANVTPGDAIAVALVSLH